MASENVPPDSGQSKEGWPTIGGRCRPSDKRLVDIAAAHVQKKRGDFIVEAAVEKAIKIMEEQAA
ncbi:MAG TPA: DUF1778 domain-containing protein [Reyranella sp.]|nr:DUF1778 domain-containing protein [Reyranella sp.]